MSSVLQQPPSIAGCRVFGIQEGFAVEITGQKQRGSLGGWRFRGLRWIND